MTIQKIPLRQKSLESLSKQEAKQLSALTIQGSGLKEILKEYKELIRAYEAGEIPQRSLIKNKKTIGLIGSKRSIKAWYLIGKDASFISPKTTVFIYVYVTRGLRKKGLGTSILFKAIREAAKSGNTKAYVYPQDIKSERFFNQPKVKEYCKKQNIRLIVV